MQDYRELEVYKESYSLCLEISKEFLIKLDEVLGKQLLRSITSVPGNIAEMCAYDSKAQLAHMLKIAIGEVNESEFWINYYSDLSVIDQKKGEYYSGKLRRIKEILQSMLHAHQQNLKEKYKTTL